MTTPISEGGPVPQPASYHVGRTGPELFVPASHELELIDNKERNVLEIAQRVLKGLAAAASAAVASYGVAITDGTVTAEEWITLAVAALGAGLIVWAVPNRPAAS